MEEGTYGEPVLLVGRSGGWGELGGVGGSQLQTVALHSSILGHVGNQGLQSHVLFLPKMVPRHDAPHKVHLCRKWKALSLQIIRMNQSLEVSGYSQEGREVTSSRLPQPKGT